MPARIWRKEKPRALLAGMQLVQTLWKTVWNFLKKLKIDPVIPLLRIYTKNPETPIQKNLCTLMFIAALFTIAKIQKLVFINHKMKVVIYYKNMKH